MKYGIDRPAIIPRIPIDEILRYAGMPKYRDKTLISKAEAVAEVCRERMQPAVLHRTLGIVSCEGERVILEDGICLTGSLVSRYLSGCRAVCILVGTVGLQVDRMIAAYAQKSGLEGLLADAAGSAAIEAVLDDFCDRISAKYPSKPRISPGYGDFPLANQRVIFSLLNTTRKLGVCLNDALLISPSKSVSALVGLSGEYHV